MNKSDEKSGFVKTKRRGRAKEQPVELWEKKEDGKRKEIKENTESPEAAEANRGRDVARSKVR